MRQALFFALTWAEKQMFPSYRQCTDRDLDALVKLARETYITAFEAVNDPKDFKEYIDKAFHPTTLEREIHTEGSSFYFVLEGDAQTDLFDRDAMELERIYLLQDNQGKGLGPHILQEVIRLSRERNKKILWLGVWEHNPGAIKFYTRHNFQKFGQHPYYIGTDKQTDWLLRLEL